MLFSERHKLIILIPTLMFALLVAGGCETVSKVLGNDPGPRLLYEDVADFNESVLVPVIRPAILSHPDLTPLQKDNTVADIDEFVERAKELGHAGDDAPNS